MLACSKAVQRHAGLMMDAMVQDLERATGPWHAEWLAIQLHADRRGPAPGEVRPGWPGCGCRADGPQPGHEPGANRGGGGDDGPCPHVGRQDAHDLVYAACWVANNTGVSLADALSQQPGITAHLDPAAIARLTDPANYLGAAPGVAQPGLPDPAGDGARHRTRAAGARGRAAVQDPGRHLLAPDPHRHRAAGVPVRGRRDRVGRRLPPGRQARRGGAGVFRAGLHRGTRPRPGRRSCAGRRAEHATAGRRSRLGRHKGRPPERGGLHPQHLCRQLHRRLRPRRVAAGAGHRTDLRGCHPAPVPGPARARRAGSGRRLGRAVRVHPHHHGPRPDRDIRRDRPSRSPRAGRRCCCPSPTWCCRSTPS
jgi:hypothetical protein